MTELDSFVYKFHQLWKAGLTVHLDVDAHAGKAWVGLRVQLGHVPGPAHHQVYPSHSKTSHHPRRGPAYQRRQERRQAARAADEPPPPTAEVSDDMPAAIASNENETVQDALAEKLEEITTSADQVLEEFQCGLCDFKSNWENGLRIHMTRKHPHIEQLDGCDSIRDDLEDDDNCMISRYWKEGKLGSIFQTYLDVLDIIEKSELSEKSKDDERAKVLEARKDAFGKDFELFPPWSSK